jgi:hypothetical protein
MLFTGNLTIRLGRSPAIVIGGGLRSNTFIGIFFLAARLSQDAGMAGTDFLSLLWMFLLY